MTIYADKISSGYDKWPVINKQSLIIDDGKINIIIGKNGCGKSTLLKSLCRQLHLSSGSVKINGININAIVTKELAKMIGVLFQENKVPQEMTVRELVSYGRFAQVGLFAKLDKNDDDIIDRSMRITGTMQFADREVAALSSGQRQLVWIALLLAQEATHLFLDEPTTYLDLENQFAILNCLVKINREEKKTIVMVLHDLNLAAQYADTLIVMKKGEIVLSGSPVDILTTDLIKDVFCINADVKKQDGRMLCIPIR